MPAPVEHAEVRAAELGHRIEWTIIGDRLAHGSCKRCGAPLHVTSGVHDGDTMAGEALVVACPKATASA